MIRLRVERESAMVPRPADGLSEATIELDAIAYNTALIADQAKTGIMAVVKADAFGHGMLPVARTALAHGASWLGVATLGEALSLRKAGISAPILSWLHTHRDDFGPAIKSGVDLSVSSMDHLNRIAECANAIAETATVHLKIDTGLSRNGASSKQWPALITRARQHERDGCLHVRGIWSHLVYAGHPECHTTRRQRELFDIAVATARGAGLDPDVNHLANSTAALSGPGAAYDMVRAGIGLYGIEPTGAKFGLRLAMTLRARTVLVKDVPMGTGVSYDHHYVTSGNSRLILVPIGYADGVPRLISDRAVVWVAGHRRRIAGSIAMDQFVVDAGDVDIALGDEVVLFGPGHNGEPTVTDWAQWASTVPHEIFTGIGNRVRRRYVGGQLY